MTSRKPPGRGDVLATAESSRQTQAERRETAEKAILDAATVIVSERGLNELTLNGAGEAAGYSRALPAHYYGTRSALLHALADHIMASYVARMRYASVAAEGGMERLCNIIEFAIDDAVKNPTSARAYQTIMASGLNHPDLSPTVERITRQGIDDFAGLIKMGQANGEIRADIRARAEASIILASLRGVIFQWLIIPDHVSLSRMRDSLVMNIRNTLKA